MDSLEKQLICPICLEMFTKPVVILPCQHNLCRKCANDVFQASNPYLPTRGGSVTSGGRFRCPSCRHEVVLDRHGVYGLQRNLLVENIIDMFKQGSTSSKPEPEKKEAAPMCEVHAEERINIYCVTHSAPTCSMCKVFGAHKDCEVAPLTSVYQTQKTQLNDGIALIVGNSDRMQGIISQLEQACLTIEENGRRQKALICEKFDQLFNVLEDKKRSMNQKVTTEQEEKLHYIRRLTQRYGDHLEESCKAVESGIRTMEEPEMARFLQVRTTPSYWLADASSTAHLDTVEHGYESMDHFEVDFHQEGDALRSIDFIDEGANRVEEEEVVAAAEVAEVNPEKASGGEGGERGGGGGGGRAGLAGAPREGVGPFLVLRPQTSLAPQPTESHRSLGLLHRMLSKRWKKTEYQGATNRAFEAD
ncbi:unnamed protein product [Lota lota]